MRRAAAISAATKTGHAEAAAGGGQPDRAGGSRIGAGGMTRGARLWRQVFGADRAGDEGQDENGGPASVTPMLRSYVDQRVPQPSLVWLGRQLAPDTQNK